MGILGCIDGSGTGVPTHLNVTKEQIFGIFCLISSHSQAELFFDCRSLFVLLSLVGFEYKNVVISGFRRRVNEMFTIPGSYTAHVTTHNNGDLKNYVRYD